MDTMGIKSANEEDIQEVEGSWGSLQIFQGWNNTNNTVMSQTSPENAQLEPHTRAVCHSEQMP